MTVLAIIGIIIGGLMTLCTPFSLVFMFIDFGVPNPAMDMFKNEPLLRAVNIISTIFFLLLMVGLLICSIASLTLKPWARSGMVVVSAVGIIYILVSQVLQLLWMGPKMEAAMQAAGAPTQGMFMMPTWIGVIVGLLIMLPYPLFVLYFFTRQHVRDAFNRAEATAV